ncbi:hypothetical protein HDU82_006728 [Entophlyctis luteolus]|nr:hypothetical protein HDU82_006728 [Entophlyctis luteolus]
MALVFTLFYYVKTYKFAMKILAENEAAIKQNRQSSLKVLESLNNINSLATTQLITQSAVSNMEISSNFIFPIEHSPETISLVCKEVMKSVTLLPGNTAALPAQDILVRSDIMANASHRSTSHANVNRSTNTVVAGIAPTVGPFGGMEIPPLPVKRSASVGTDAINAARRQVQARGSVCKSASVHSSITFPTAALPSVAATAQPSQSLQQHHLDDLVERVRDISRSLDASLQQLQRENDRIALEWRLLCGCLLMASSLIVCYMPYVAFLALLAAHIGATVENSAITIYCSANTEVWLAVAALAAADPFVSAVLILYFQKDLRACVFGNLRTVIGLKGGSMGSDRTESFCQNRSKK